MGRHRTEDRPGRHLSGSSTPEDGRRAARPVARHAAAAARTGRPAVRSRAARVALSLGVGAAVVAAGTAAVTTTSPTTTTGGAASALALTSATPAPDPVDVAALPDDAASDLRAEGAVADDHRAAVRDRRAAAAAAEAARAEAERAEAERAEAERAEAERAAAEELAAREAVLAAEEEAASRSVQRDPRGVAADMVAERGWSADQFDCLDSLWTKESGWQWDADNPTSSAYGIPQSLPGEKMASAGADWETNPVTQIAWGLGYIDDVYGTPCSAWSHSQAVNWY